EVSTEPGISTTALASSGVGSYPIALDGGSDDNYDITLKAGELEVTKAALTITADDQSKVYGEENPSLTFTYFGLVNGDTEVSTEPGISTAALASSGVGTYPITLDGGSDDNYAITLEAGELEVTRASLTITADDQSKVYGEENPSLTFTYFGLANGDTEVSTEPGISTAALASSGVGTYPITLDGGSDDNYAITLKAGELEVTRASLTITADDQSKVYGEENPSLTFTYFGLVNGDTEVSTEPGISTAALASSGVGTYPISLDGGSDDNYDITLKAGELAVTKAALTITADDQSKVYGEENPSLTFTYFGLVNGDTEVSTEPGISTTALASSGVGTYPISLDGGSDDNYDITLKAGELAISKAVLTITADNQSRVYGEENPSLTFSYFGLVNGNTEVSTEPGISTTALVGSSVGNYPISLEGGSDDNYAITLKAGELAVTKAALTITADDQSKVYGEENPSLTFTYVGLVNGDTEVSTAPDISTTALASSGVGTYPITLDGGSDDNYSITLENGALEVTKAALTITADNQSKVYGEENPDLTFSYVGLVNGDTEVSTKPGISTTAMASSGVGTYPISLDGGSDDNYAITLKTGELAVTKAALTITADDKSKVYGEENPSLTFSYYGLVNGDTEVSTAPGISTTALASSGVGTYPISLEGGSDDNYSLTLVGAQMEVTPALLSIVAVPGIYKIQGTKDPELQFNVSGLVAGDKASIISGKPDREEGERAGVYSIGLGNLDAGNNYKISFTSATFEIQLAELVEVIHPGDVETPWSLLPELPETVLVMTEDGRFMELPVTWGTASLNTLARGEYHLEGELVLADGLKNPRSLIAQLAVIVQAKQAPTDIILSSDTFQADSRRTSIDIGGISVQDNVDDVHYVELIPGAAENAFFTLDEGTLYWSSDDPVAGKSDFAVAIRATDRDGNALEKNFTVKRLRISLQEITIYNTFTPNGDGDNDTWGVPDIRFFKGARVQVFEGSGRRVFYTEDPDQRWDGTFMGKELPVNTYYWTVEVVETGEKRKGIMTLLRR
ncbi:MBG domain-containing protein, partial [Pleomorphovibrio marinus]|uniref:MBG domain-containing protein n=1 Tax=Pleomorphovibrio marinus TaxID=2164132 RepID=UPI0013002535